MFPRVRALLGWSFVGTIVLGFAPAGPVPTAAAGATPAAARDLVARVAATFLPNHGDAPTEVLYLARADGWTASFTQEGVIYAFAPPGADEGHALALRFQGARRATPTGRAPLGARFNFLRGRDRAGWRTGVPGYSEVVYPGLWPGVDLVFTRATGTVKYEVRVEAGADLNGARFVYEGAEKVTLGTDGSLCVRTPIGDLHDEAPRSYQVADGVQVPIESRFVLHDDGTFGFAVDNRDAALPLVSVAPVMTLAEASPSTARDTRTSRALPTPPTSPRQPGPSTTVLGGDRESTRTPSC